MAASANWQKANKRPIPDSSSRPVTNMDVRMISHYLWRENG